MAAAREAERTKDWPDSKKKPANSTNDPGTIGGAKRGEPMEREKANSGNVNPDFMKVKGSTINCQSCVVAFEARLRGYDVKAKPNFNNPSAKHLSHKTSDAWIDPATGKPPEMKRNPENIRTWKQTKKWLEENVKEGERYTFQHAWKGKQQSGHIISVDRDKSGALRLYDPQTGRTYMGKDADAYLSRTKANSTIMGMKFPRLGLTRVDNMQINPEYADGIMEAIK